tara:strand:- start:2257 stop:5526 length:3270 start_codon:yes stop_codon:yes gene_type:complete
MVIQEHSGPGDNVAGNKYESIIQSVQARDLIGVTETIMRDIRYRDFAKANEKLQVLLGINSLEADVQLLLRALQIKIEFIDCVDPLSKSELLRLLNQEALPKDVREVVTSILIELEFKTAEKLARERYNDLSTNGIYLREVFYENLASEAELKDSFQASKVYNLTEQELTGLVRGAMRVKNFLWALELAQYLNEYFPSTNAETLLFYIEVHFFVNENRGKYLISLSKQEKKNLDRLVEKLQKSIVTIDDNRLIASLINLLNLTHFSDAKLYRLGKLHLKAIRKMSPKCAEDIENLSDSERVLETPFELTSDSLDLKQFTKLDYALQNKQIKVSTLNNWVEQGGVVLTGDDYINSLFDLYLRATICSSDSKKEIQLLDEKAKLFFQQGANNFLQINPYAIVRLCEKFIDLGLPLNAVMYLEPFLSNEAWVSAVFECYLDALLVSEKFDLFLSRIVHLEQDEKTASINLREAQVYERLNKYELSIKSIRAAINISPHSPYSWHLLLRVSRAKGLSKEEIDNIVFEIPEVIFQSFDETKVPLVNEIAVYVDYNLADRILVDWFVQSPLKVATVLTQIHINSLSARPDVTKNPYTPQNCCDGVTYSDGFDTFTRLLVKDVECSHPLLLDVESPLGQTLNAMKKGDTSGYYTMLERLPSYVAAYRYSLDIRNNGYDGTNGFRMFTIPSNKGEMIPYIESIIKRFSPADKTIDDTLNKKDIPLIMRGHYTDEGTPIRGALKHLSSSETTKYMKLFNGGEEQFDKVIIDVYTAVYIALTGLAVSIQKLDLEIIFCKYTREILESWVSDIQRDDYMSLGVTEDGMYRVTSKEIKRDYQDMIKGVKVLLEHSKVEPLEPADTPELLVKIRDLVDNSVYSTFQLSAANKIPLLCIDHLMMGFAHSFGCPAANMNSFVGMAITSLSLNDRKKSIQYNLFFGTPVSILYQDIIELSRSNENSDTYLVFMFMKKYGDNINLTGAPLEYLTDIVKNVTAQAFIEGTILNGGRLINPQYDGYAQHVFNLCCRAAMKSLDGETAEYKFSMLIFSIFNTASRASRYIKLISYLASEFVEGHFLDIDECNKVLASLQMKFENSKSTE